MAGGEDYRNKAAEIQALAETEIGESGRAEYMQLVKGYLLLAELAERNQTTDIVYETPPAGAAGNFSPEDAAGHVSAEDSETFDPPPNVDGDAGLNT